MTTCRLTAMVLTLGAAAFARAADDAQERLVLDNASDVAAWYNGSPEETTLSQSDRHPEGGRFSLKFANVVDYTRGEKNYPIGWPRTGKDLGRARQTDWSAWDFFECWVYAETSRAALPGNALHVGFYHSGPKQSSSFPLKQVKKDSWVKIVIPISDLHAAGDVQRVQFNISESDYKHGDRVDFYLANVALTRFSHAVVAELRPRRKLVYSGATPLDIEYRLMGFRETGGVSAELEIGRGNQGIARSSAPAVVRGELRVLPDRPLEPGSYWAKLSLRDQTGKILDHQQAEFRVIQGPF